MALPQNTITSYKPETINIFGVQYGNEKIADETLQEMNDPEILDTRYILCNAKNSDIVAVIKHPPEDHYLAEVDCRYKALSEWGKILTPPDMSILPKRPHIECSSDENYFDRFKCLLECEIDMIDSQLRGLPGTNTKWPKRMEAKGKLFAYLGDYKI